MIQHEAIAGFTTITLGWHYASKWGNRLGQLLTLWLQARALGNVTSNLRMVGINNSEVCKKDKGRELIGHTRSIQCPAQDCCVHLLLLMVCQHKPVLQPAEQPSQRLRCILTITPTD
jgi:hypothetical protein